MSLSLSLYQTSELTSEKTEGCTKPCTPWRKNPTQSSGYQLCTSFYSEHLMIAITGQQHVV